MSSGCGECQPWIVQCLHLRPPGFAQVPEVRVRCHSAAHILPHATNDQVVRRSVRDFLSFELNGAWTLS